jgi:hypothetical protein
MNEAGRPRVLSRQHRAMTTGYGHCGMGRCHRKIVPPRIVRAADSQAAPQGAMVSINQVASAGLPVGHAGNEIGSGELNTSTRKH